MLTRSQVGRAAAAFALAFMMALAGWSASSVAQTAAPAPLTPRALIPSVGCDGCAIPTSPAAPANARIAIADCGVDVTCTQGGHVRITVTYLWPGGDPATGLVADQPQPAQTCIRAWAEPPELEMVPAGYAFGGDCSTNVSGTSAEFRFSGVEPVLFCAQVDAFRGSMALGSSNLACAMIEPPEGLG